MKKIIISAALVLAMILSLFSFAAAADTPWEYCQMDFVLLWDKDVAFKEVMGKGGELGQIKPVVDAGANGICLMGWYYPPTTVEIVDYGYQVDDGEIVYGSIACINDANLAPALVSFGGDWVDRASYARNFNGNIPIQTGSHTVKLIVKFADGSTKAIYQTHYANDDSDVALNKPVRIDLKNGVRNGSGYWDDAYVNDGYNPNHKPDVVPDPVPLGFYPVAAGHVVADIYIDLEGLYDLSRVDLHSQGFYSQTFPNTYNLYTSVDGVKWDKIGGDSGRQGEVDTATPFSFATSNRARFIKLEVLSGNAVDDSGFEYLGIGEIEAYGTYAGKSNIVKPGYIPYSNYSGSVAAGDPGGNSAWTGFTTGTLTYKFLFNTDVSFYKIGFPAAWGYAGTPLKFEFKKGGEVVATAEYTAVGDSPFTLDIGKTLEAGEYEVVVTIMNDEVRPEGDDNAGAYVCYMVFGYATEGVLDESYFAQERGKIAFDIYSDETNGQGFIKREYKQHANIDAVSLDGENKGNENGLSITVDENSQNILVHGWLAANYPIEKYGYKIDGGETVYDESFITKDFGTAENPNADALAIYGVSRDLFSAAGNGFRGNVVVPVIEGGHNIDIVALANGEEHVFYSFTYAPEGVHVPVTRSFDANTDNQYFDSIFVNDEAAPRANGNDEVAALKALIDGSAGDIEKLGLFGWFASDSPIVQFGYVLDGAAPVFDDAFVAPFGSSEEEATITGTRAGGKRYRVNVDVTRLNDGRTHEIKVVAKLENGDTVIFDRANREAIVYYKAPGAELPGTGDAMVIVLAVIALLAMSAAVVFVRRKSH
ncbi:MAG: LPXTG cell wall anchor domain-containing protein [Clostridia bacterium]|nr:LPXTG cell wall anchor domain-containing protein [Clostridia bacterium]